MAYIHRLPSGNWRAVVRAPGNRRVSKTDRSKTVVREWALDLEAEYRRGSRRDPHAGRTLLADWHARWRPAQMWVTSHAERMDGVWRNYVDPQWGHWQLAAISPMDVQAWVAKLTRGGTGAATVHKAVDLLSSLLKGAIGQGLIEANPARLPKGRLPKMDRRAPAFYTHEQAAALLRAVDQRYAVMVELALYMGLRWEELVGLRVTDVDTRLGLIHVTHVLERGGTLRAYPKSRKSYRSVPVPGHLAADLAEWVDGLPPDELLFLSPDRHPLAYQNFLRRVWKPAIAQAGIPDLGIHGMRHTAASWLVMEGVDLYRVRDLLGHESIETTQRYAHLSPTAHDAVTAAWSAMTIDAAATVMGRELGD